MSDPAHSIFLPAFALVALTFVVWLNMFQMRVGEMRRLRIHPQAVATSPQAAQRFVDTRAADNFRNLFELPVLFCVALGIAHATRATGPVVLAIARAFVVLRVAHSAIHCSYNRVMHRFAVYAFGGFVLLALWALLAWQLL